LATTGAKPVTVTTDVPCVPTELQALGRWVYWSCGANGPAGVWNGTTRKSTRVPAGYALLGDGYVLRHTGGQLVLTDVHSGTAAADRIVAQLAASAYPDDRNITWTVDKFRGFLAYGDAAGATHVVPSGVPATPIAVLQAPPAPYDTVGSPGWTARWITT